MKRMVMAMILAMALGLAAGTAWSGEPAKGPTDLPNSPQTGRQQVACPIEHDKINKNLFVDYQGQRIYFCCPACIPIFKKNPEKYLQQMQQEGVTPEKTPAGS